MTVGLMMIVKDEAHVIERCLASVRPFVDWWVIVDTGSTDGTQELVRSSLSSLPGDLVESPWVDFGHNRQEVLELARSSPHRDPDSYVLSIDADEQLAGAALSMGDGHAGYHLPVSYGGVNYSRLALVRLDQPWQWVGPVHEYLDLPGASVGTLDGPTIMVTHDGARSRDPETYQKDAALLEDALAESPGEPRLQFYLAQSWRDAGELEKALAGYVVRAGNSAGWDQERFVSLLEIARLLERLGQPAQVVADAYLTAHQSCPWRAEPLVDLARLERGRDRFAAALLYARPATALPLPGGEALFVEAAAYTSRPWDEVAVSAYWCGLHQEALVAAERALEGDPGDERLQENVAQCRLALRPTEGEPDALHGD